MSERPKFAAETQISAAKTKQEIESVLIKYGATDFLYGWSQSGSDAIVGFAIQGRQVKILLPLPDKTSDEFAYVKTGTYSRRVRSQQETEAAWEKATRQKWRALLLIIKAKLEAIDSGITTLEGEFLKDVVMADGTTVGEWIRPQIEQMYLTGRMPPLLPAPRNT